MLFHAGIRSKYAASHQPFVVLVCCVSAYALYYFIINLRSAFFNIKKYIALVCGVL